MPTLCFLYVYGWHIRPDTAYNTVYTQYIYTVCTLANILTEVRLSPIEAMGHGLHTFSSCLPARSTEAAACSTARGWCCRQWASAKCELCRTFFCNCAALSCPLASTVAPPAPMKSQGRDCAQSGRMLLSSGNAGCRPAAGLVAADTQQTAHACAMSACVQLQRRFKERRMALQNYTRLDAPASYP
jgi:hypothetical protein